MRIDAAMELPREVPGLRYMAQVAVALAALLLLGVIAYGAKALGDAQPRLARVAVAGPFEAVPAAAVERVLKPFVGRPLLAVDLIAAQKAVAALPWVARARVQRRWPDALQVRIWEREAFARWNQDALLDTQAEMFVPPAADQPAGLPALSGPPGRERLVMDAYTRLGEPLASSPLALAGLALDERGEWTATTRSGVELRLGLEPPQSKLPMLTGAVMQTLSERIADVRYVDLRYTNGFAVGWRAPGDAAAGGENG